MQIKTTMSYPLTPLEQPLFKKKNKQKISAGKDVEKVPPLGTVSRIMKWYSESHSVMSNSLGPHGLYSPWNSPGQNTGLGSLSLLQGIFPTQ